jgi:CO dehydrogenase maturation factor
MEHLSRRTTNNVDVLVAVVNPAEPSLRAARRILDLSRELPVQIAHRALLVTRARPLGRSAVVEAGLADLVARHDVARLDELPQDDDVERATAEGRDVFSIAEGSPALVATRAITEQIKALAAVAP